jgi:hypothetical protein
MVWFAGAMVNAILRRHAIIIKSLIAKVYGRLMAGLAQTQKKQIRLNDRFESQEPVMDADFETIVSAPNAITNGLAAAPKIKDNKADSPSLHADKMGSDKIGSDKVGMSVFGKKPARPMPDDSIAFYGFGAILVMLSFWVSGGHSLFRTVDLMPTGAIHAKNSSFEIADTAWRVVTVDGRSALHVEGIVRNSGRLAVHTKPVTVTVKHSDGLTKRYLLGQKGWTLGPGQEVVVSGRLDIASAAIASVAITLAD